MLEASPRIRSPPTCRCSGRVRFDHRARPHYRRHLGSGTAPPSRIPRGARRHSGHSSRHVLLPSTDRESIALGVVRDETRYVDDAVIHLPLLTTPSHSGQQSVEHVGRSGQPSGAQVDPCVVVQSYPPTILKRSEGCGRPDRIEEGVLDAGGHGPRLRHHSNKGAKLRVCRHRGQVSRDTDVGRTGLIDGATDGCSRCCVTRRPLRGGRSGWHWLDCCSPVRRISFWSSISPPTTWTSLLDYRVVMDRDGLHTDRAPGSD